VLEIEAAGFRFVARWEDELAPSTVAAFKAILPFEDRIIHCRWSGELLFPYGYCHFKSKAGELWANHFATLVEGAEHLKELGRLTLWEGAQEISFRES
jgi:uncharacterized protein DUF3830